MTALDDARNLVLTQIVDGPPSSITPSKLRQILIEILDSLDTEVLTHASLDGLTNDDHPQYFNTTRGDARYAKLDSPAFTNAPTAPTQATTDNSTKLATTKFVKDVVTASTVGVSSYNGRTGAVTATFADVTGALGYKPALIGSASDLLAGEEGFAVDFLSRTAVINDYADALLNAGRPGDILTVSRASTKMVVNRNRLLASVASNTLAYDHDPVTGAPLGVLIEPASTNLILTSAGTAAQGVSNVMITPNSAVFADGSNTMLRLQSSISGGSDTCRIDHVVAVADDTVARTFSVFLREGTSPTSTINFYYAGGASTQVVGTINWTAKTIAIAGGSGRLDHWGGGLYRVQVTLANNASGNTMAVCRVYVRDSGTSNVSGETVFAGGWQLEVGSVATSYILTTGSQATRAADSVSLATTAFPVNAAQGTLYAEFIVPSINVGYPRLVSLNDGTGNNYIDLLTFDPGGPCGLGVLTGGASQAILLSYVNVVTAGTVQRVTGAYAAGNFSSYRNGSIVGTDDVGTIPPVTRLQLGSANGGTLRGWLRKAAYISRPLSADEQKTITA